MVARYSRWASAVLIPTRRSEDLFTGWWQLINTLGAVPRVLVWDGEGAIGRWRGKRSELTADCQGFRGTLAAKVLICRPGEPVGQGAGRKAARLPGTLVPARSRLHLTWGLQHPAPGVPGAGEHPPPPTVGVPTGRPRRCRPGRDAHSSAGATGGGLASQHAVATGLLGPLGRQRLLGAPGGHRSADRGGGGPTPGPGRLRGAAGRRPRTVWAKHRTITDPAHLVAARALRRERLELVRPTAQPQVEQRDLAEYDAAMGTDSGLA